MKNQNLCSDCSGEPLTADQRRTVTVDQHAHWQKCLAVSDDELDDDLNQVPWPEMNPPSRRKDSDLARVLDLLDNLPKGKDSK